MVNQFNQLHISSIVLGVSKEVLDFVSPRSHGERTGSGSSTRQAAVAHVESLTLCTRAAWYPKLYAM